MWCGITLFPTPKETKESSSFLPSTCRVCLVVSSHAFVTCRRVWRVLARNFTKRLSRKEGTARAIQIMAFSLHLASCCSFNTLLSARRRCDFHSDVSFALSLPPSLSSSFFLSYNTKVFISLKSDVYLSRTYCRGSEFLTKWPRNGWCKLNCYTRSYDRQVEMMPVEITERSLLWDLLLLRSVYPKGKVRKIFFHKDELFFRRERK